MKQLSIFLVFILFLNTFVLISTSQNGEYEIPQIRKTIKPDLNLNKERSFRKLSAEEDKDIEKYEKLEENFNPEKILNWINETQKKDITNMKKEEVNHILDGIKAASVKIQNYLTHSSRVIGANINMIELKVDEIDKIDYKVSSLKPDYKNELERINSGSGSLINALQNEKNAIKRVLTKLRTKKIDLKKTANRTTSVAKKIQKIDSARQVKDKIDTLIVPFIKFENFENSRKKLMAVVDTTISSMNFDKELSTENISKFAHKLIEDNWKRIIEEKVEVKEEKVKEAKVEKKVDTMKDSKAEFTDDFDEDDEDDEETFDSKDALKIEENLAEEKPKRKSLASKRKNEKKVNKIMTLRKHTNVIDEMTDETTTNKFNRGNLNNMKSQVPAELLENDEDLDKGENLNNNGNDDGDDGLKKQAVSDDTTESDGNTLEKPDESLDDDVEI